MALIWFHFLTFVYFALISQRKRWGRLTARSNELLPVQLMYDISNTIKGRVS
jgi:hypothetical protein